MEQGQKLSNRVKMHSNIGSLYTICYYALKKLYTKNCLFISPLILSTWRTPAAITEGIVHYAGAEQNVVFHPQLDSKMTANNSTVFQMAEFDMV